MGDPMMIFGITNEFAGWAGAFAAAFVAAIYAKRNEHRGKIVEKEVVGTIDEPTLRQMMLNQDEKSSTHRIEVIGRLGDLMSEAQLTNGRITKLEHRLNNLETGIKNVGPSLSGK
mgnify:CR=1 FL=1